MAAQPGSLLVPAVDKRPLMRSRSSTALSKEQLLSKGNSAARPESAPRSHSYLSAAGLDLGSSRALPDATPSSRLHIPGSSSHYRPGHERRHSSRHHHTQSDVHGGRTRSHRRDRSEGRYHLTAGIAGAKEKITEQAKLPNEMWGARTHDLRRIATNRSHRPRVGGTTTEEVAGLRKTNSTPVRRAQQYQRSHVEVLLDEAEARKMAIRATASQKDIDKIHLMNAEAEEELQRRLTAVNKTSVDITRRLDYTYYNLLEKVGDTLAIVQSFQALSSQTKEMTDHFTREASMLESDVKRKVETLKKTFDEREMRVKQLEERGSRAHTKAQELGARLENARSRLEAWEKKEGEEKRRRSWFWRSTWTVVALILVLIFFGLTWREWLSEIAIVRMVLTDNGGNLGVLNQSLFADTGGVSRMEVLGDVKSILSGFAARRSLPASTPVVMPVTTTHSNRLELDERLRILDEL